MGAHLREQTQEHTRAQNKHTHKLQHTSYSTQAHTQATADKQYTMAGQQISYSMTQRGVPVLPRVFRRGFRTMSTWVYHR